MNLVDYCKTGLCAKWQKFKIAENISNIQIIFSYTNLNILLCLTTNMKCRRKKIFAKFFVKLAVTIFAVKVPIYATTNNYLVILHFQTWFDEFYITYFTNFSPISLNLTNFFHFSGFWQLCSHSHDWWRTLYLRSFRHCGSGRLRQVRYIFFPQKNSH